MKRRTMNQKVVSGPRFGSAGAGRTMGWDEGSNLITAGGCISNLDFVVTEKQIWCVAKRAVDSLETMQLSTKSIPNSIPFVSRLCREPYCRNQLLGFQKQMAVQGLRCSG